MIYQKNILGIQLNGAGDALSVLWSENENAEDEQVERPLQKRFATLFFTAYHSVGLDANP
jgi:hypothetical protein